MIFFSVPSVGQLKSETLFGDDDHYGFIQTLLGIKYERDKIKKKCCEYYNTTNERYWDQIITIANFLGIKKLDSKNRFCNIPLLDFIAEQFDNGDLVPSDILFDYLLCQWQYPHPIVTTNRNIKVLNVKLVNPRLKVQVFRPYILLLCILREIYNKSPESAYLTKEEFYWFGFQAYQSAGASMKIDNVKLLAESILKIRENGWSDYGAIKGNKATHLSYPFGFIRNSSVLTDDKTQYNAGSEFFIGIKKSEAILEDIDSLINSSTNEFKFDPSKASSNTRLSFEYSSYLYNKDSLKKWLEGVTIYSRKREIFNNAYSVDNFLLDDNELKKKKAENLLSRLSELDKVSNKKTRKEQYILREFLLGGRDVGSCAICKELFPVRFLTTAHIKKRAICSIEEKKDINNVFPTCHFGCDKLFEDGYVVVNEGNIENNISNKIKTSAIEKYIERINTTKCDYFNEKNRKYFKEHAKQNI